MPWHLVERDGRTCVVKDGETEPIAGGCHDTREQAQSHLNALYAAEPSAARSATAGCSCQTAHAHAGPLTAAATEPLDSPFPVPAYPPRSWFTEKPDWLVTPQQSMAAHLAAGGSQFDAPLLKLQIADDGRVAGYFHDRGQCLVHDPRACPAASPTRHAAFHQSNLVTADGEMITVGIIGNVGGHANPHAPVSVAQAHYADPNAAIVAGRAYDDEHGGYILGSVVPWATYGDVARARLHPLSGDWRPMARAWWDAHGITAAAIRECEGYDCIGPTFVNRPGLPLVRRALRGSVEELPMAESAPVVVHQHFHDSPPGPVLDPARAAAVADAARTAADEPGEPMEDEATETPDVAELAAALEQALAVIADHEQRLAALEGAAAAAVDAELAALEASAIPLS